MPRVLVLATTTGYQTRAFGDAAARIGMELVFATDRCHLLDDPWQDGAIAIRFYDEDASVAAIVDAARARPLDGMVVVGDRPTVIAARAAEALGIPFHSPDAAAIAGNKERTRERLRDAGLPVPWWIEVDLRANPDSRPSTGSGRPQRAEGRVPSPAPYPCVLKPVSLSGSRGVMRADSPDALAEAIERLRAIVASPDVRSERNDAHHLALIEGFIPGPEYAVEALMHHGELCVLAIFDKPDPLDGPFFEETIYLTPSIASARTQRAIVQVVARAADAIGLRHGPIHAECRVNDAGVFVLEVAARPIGGLCARALWFEPVGLGNRGENAGTRPSARPEPVEGRDSGFGIRIPSDESRIPNPDSRIPFEELLLRHAIGEAPTWRREGCASGVMMVPIPRRGIFRGASGLAAAAAVPLIVDVRITAKPDQLLLPPPEGASYLGFLFARGVTPREVEDALRAAHARLTFQIDAEFPLLTAAQIQYNLQHG